MKNKVILDVWSFNKDKKLPCAFCDKRFTRTRIIKHLVKEHDWKLRDAKEAFKEIESK